MYYRLKPKKVMRGKTLKRWYRCACEGELPVGWRDRPAVKVHHTDLRRVLNSINIELRSLRQRTQSNITFIN